jgi:hypothetical protein
MPQVSDLNFDGLGLGICLSKLQLLVNTWITCPQVRELELVNPGRRAMSYTARLEGPPCFSVDPPTLKIDPGRPAHLSMKYHPSISLPKECFLMLTSKRDQATGSCGGVGTTSTAPAALVFALRGTVLIGAPLKRIEASSVLYGLSQFDVVITNPYPTGRCALNWRRVQSKARH